MVRLVKFLTVGASGTVISLGLLYLLTDIAGWHYLASNLVAFVAAVGNNYLWNSLWTFRDKKASKTGLGKYTLVSSGTLLLNEAMLFILTDIWKLWYMASAIIVIAIISLVNFLLSRRFVWNKPKQSIA